MPKTPSRFKSFTTKDTKDTKEGKDPGMHAKRIQTAIARAPNGAGMTVVVVLIGFLRVLCVLRG
jgi:hypothetical protein